MNSVKLSFIPALLLVTAVAASSQMSERHIERGDSGKKVIIRDGAEEMFHIPELAAMIIESDGKIVVDHVIEEGMRPKGYEKTEVAEGDVIAMANGQKVATASALKDLYTKAEIGSTIKLGIKRKDEMLIASFVKADPKDMPKMRMMISREGGDIELLGIPQVGLILSKEGERVVVKEVLPENIKKLDAEVRSGDVLKSLGNSEVTSFKWLREHYEKIGVGEKVQFTFSRGSKQYTVTFAKPKDEGKMMIRRKEK